MAVLFRSVINRAKSFLVYALTLCVINLFFPYSLFRPSLDEALQWRDSLDKLLQNNCKSALFLNRTRGRERHTKHFKSCHVFLPECCCFFQFSVILTKKGYYEMWLSESQKREGNILWRARKQGVLKTYLVDCVSNHPSRLGEPGEAV